MARWMQYITAILLLALVDGPVLAQANKPLPSVLVIGEQHLFQPHA